MIYKLYIADEGDPATGLTPAWETFKKVSNGADLIGPAIEEIGGGWYKFDYTATEDLIGVIDGGDALTDIDRYIPINLSAQDSFLDASVASRSVLGVDTAIDTSTVGHAFELLLSIAEGRFVLGEDKSITFYKRDNETVLTVLRMNPANTIRTRDD